MGKGRTVNHPNRTHIKEWPAHIKRFRQRHSLTQKQLAELLTSGQKPPVRESTIQRWEYGTRTPPPDLKRALQDLARELSQSTIAT
jgi:transcriptional regulator with XRE-family HTH domain